MLLLAVKRWIGQYAVSAGGPTARIHAIDAEGGIGEEMD